MHLYFANGILSWEINEIYQRWSVLGVGDLQAFLSLNWQTSLQPSCSLSWRKRLGEEWNFQNSTYKGTASHLELFFPLFEYFLSRILLGRGLLVKELRCFQVLRKITMELRSLHAQTNIGSTEKFQELQVLHHKLLVETYTGGFIKPKHHQRCHLAEQLKRIGFQVDAYATERKHKAYKSHIGLHRFDPWAQDQKGMFSQLVLKAVYQHHIQALREFTFDTHLIGQTENSENIAHTLGKTNCLVAEKIQHEGRTVGLKDVVLGAHPGIVLQAAKADSDFYILIQPLQLEERTDFWSRWKKGGNKKLLPIAQMGQRPTWFLQLDENTMLCLH